MQKTHFPKTNITFNPNEKRKKGRKNNLEEEDILCLYNIGKDIRKCCLGSSWIFMKYIYGKKPRRLPMCVTCNVKRLYSNNVILPHCGLWIYTYSLVKSEIGFLDFCFMIIEIKKNQQCHLLFVFLSDCVAVLFFIYKIIIW